MSTLARSLVRPLARSLVVDDVPLWARRLGAPSNAIRAFDWTAADRYWNTSLKSYSRASDGWQQNASGVWVRSDPGILRRADGVGALWEASAQNNMADTQFSTVSVQSYTLSGGQASMGSYWRASNVDAVSCTQKTTVNGIPVAEFTWSRVNSSGVTVYPRIDLQGSIISGSLAAAVGETWSARSYIHVVSSTHTISGIIQEYSSIGTYLTGSNFANAIASGQSGIYTGSRTLTNASVGRTSLVYGPSLLNGETFTCTLRLGLVGLEKRSSVSSPIVHNGAIPGSRAADAGALAAAGLANWTVVFDNGSTQTFSGISGDLSIVPANLNRSTIRGGWAVAA